MSLSGHDPALAKNQTNSSMQTNSNPPLIARGIRLALLAGLQLTLASAFAADLYWEGGTANISTNGDGTSAGGAGTWATTIANWDAGAGMPHTNWANGNLDNAWFGGSSTAAKTITTSSALTVNQLKLTTHNYTFGATAGTGPISFGGTYSDATPAIDNSGGTLVSGSFISTIQSKITGTINGGLVIKDINTPTAPSTAGRVYLNTSAGNDFSGNIVLLSGNLHVLSSLGNPTNKVVLKGGALFGSTGSTLTYSFNRDIVVLADSAIVNNSQAANVVMDIATNKTITGTGNLTRYNATQNAATAEVRFSGDMSGYTGTVTNLLGLMTIQTTATSAGGWVLLGGTLKLNTNNDTHIANGAGKPDLDIESGTLNLNGKSETVNGLTGAGGFVENDLTSSSSVLTLGDANASATYAGTIRNNNGTGGTLTFVKIGNGTQILSGTNQCLGCTVSGGTLQIGDGINDNPFSSPITNNAALAFNTASSETCPGVITGSGSVVQIGSGTATLSGANTYTGSTTVSNGAVVLMDTKSGGGSIIVASGASLGITRSSATGTVAASSASCDSATLNLNFNANILNSTALLTVSGVFANYGGTTVNLQGLAGLALGSYPLIKYGTYQSNAFSSVILGPMPSGVTASIQNNPGNSSLDLVITALNAVKWTGATDNNWDTSTTNWQNLSTLVAQAYSDGQYLTFDDTATGPTAILVGGNPQPGSMTVSNNSKAYSFTGAGISGGASLIKRGTGTLTLAVNNNNSGGTTIQKGTIQVGDGTTDGNIASPVINNGALVFNVLNTSTYSGISGTGALAKANSGTLSLGANSYSGATTVQQGQLQITDSAALGGTTNSATVQPGAELWVAAGGLTVPEALSLSGTGSGGGGALVVSSGSSTWSGNVTATADTTLSANSGTSLTLAGTVSGANQNLTFTPASSGYFLAASNVAAKSLLLNGQASATTAGGLLLAGANPSLTNVQVLMPVANSGTPPATDGLWARNSLALGTNSTVVLTNNQYIANFGARLGLDNNVSIPSGVSLIAYCPGDGLAGQGGYRCTLQVINSTTNTWNGPITIHGADPAIGVATYFTMYGGTSGTAGRLVINGDISGSDGSVVLLPRGYGSGGLLAGHINLGTNMFEVTDGAVWTVTSSGNIWGITQCAGGGETLALGVNNALCTSAPVWMHMNATVNTLDLSGYNQQIAGLFNDGTGSATIRNSSTNTDSTLKVFSNLGSNWLYGATLTAVTGAKALHLDVAGDTLTLNAAGNNYTGTTTVRSGATLALLASGNITASSAIDVQAGGTFDVSGTTSGGYTVPAGTTLKGNGTVVGTLSVNGSLAPGESVGVLSVLSNVVVNSGAVCAMEVDNALHTNDLLSVTGTMTYGGTLLVTNITGAAYTNNQVLKLFNATGGYSGSFASIVIPGAGAYDASNLAVNGTIKVTTLPSAPTTLNYQVLNGGTQLQLSWPASYTGWLLESQTNNLTTGISTNWYVVPGSSSVNTMTLPVVQSLRSVYYRLAHP
jgi:autotransporter-associated beta strand protein